MKLKIELEGNTTLKTKNLNTLQEKCEDNCFKSA